MIELWKLSLMILIDQKMYYVMKFSHGTYIYIKCS